MVDDEYMSPKAFDSSGGDLLSLIAFESSFFRMDIMFIPWPAGICFTCRMP
jgi:hypothetical protein